MSKVSLDNRVVVKSSSGVNTDNTICTIDFTKATLVNGVLVQDSHPLIGIIYEEELNKYVVQVGDYDSRSCTETYVFDSKQQAIELFTMQTELIFHKYLSEMVASFYDNGN